jgi:glycosyltransferase involved in cell wall biosynthesis
MERVCHIPFDRISVVYNGIPIPHSYDGDNTRQYLGIGRDTILVGTIARLIPSKGIQHLLDAIPLVMRSYKDIHFVVIGDGPYEEMLKKKAIELGIENITFVGYVNTVWGYLDAIDIFVLPTLSEGLGISILEAMAMGKPVIASRVGGIPEIINHDDNGYLISPGDSGALAFAILYLAANPQVRKDYGQRGCRDVRAHFSVEKMVDATAKILERCTHIKATPL